VRSSATTWDHLIPRQGLAETADDAVPLLGFALLPEALGGVDGHFGFHPAELGRGEVLAFGCIAGALLGLRGCRFVRGVDCNGLSRGKSLIRIRGSTNDECYRGLLRLGEVRSRLAPELRPLYLGLGRRFRWHHSRRLHSLEPAHETWWDP
jgi:hypothetical protein